MKLVDQHTHSNFSFDGKVNAEAQCEQACALGLAGLTLTEHFSVDPRDVSFGFLRKGDYQTELKRLQNKYAGTLRLGIGLEVGEPHLVPYQKILAQELASLPLDFVIGSVHNIDGKKLRLFMQGKSNHEFYTAYFQEVLQMAKTADFDVLGHLDLAKRYGTASLGHYIWEEQEPVIHAILVTIIERGKGIEINTSGWDEDANEPYPSAKILRLYHELGGQIITLGSDAHHTKNLARHFERACKLLQDIGFAGWTLYEKRKPHRISWER